MFGGQIARARRGRPPASSSVAGCTGPGRIQSFGYALFFMNARCSNLDKTNGFEVGIDRAWSSSTRRRAQSPATITSDVYAFIFDQKGLMAGLGIQGSKISRIQK
jgi:hypothetical protein